jgi:hypothetical protein
VRRCAAGGEVAEAHGGLVEVGWVPSLEDPEGVFDERFGVLATRFCWR